jgi:hypothetical protein
MTRKPPPKTHSPFVEQILAPLKDFLSRSVRSTEMDSCAALPLAGDLVERVAGEVTAQYHAAVCSLLDAVRQMDDIISRRKKKRAGEELEVPGTTPPCCER